VRIAVQNLWYSYREALQATGPVLRGVTFAIEPGEFVAIVGPSGSGKTTLIQHFTGLLKPTRGKVLIDGADVNGPGVDLVQLRRRVGLVFQFPELQLFEETVWRDVAFAPRNYGFPPDEVERRVRAALDAVGLDADVFGPRNPHQLSEGERRRVALAGVLSMDPEVLVLDEPTAGLDPGGVHKLEELLKRLHSMGKTVVLVSHHMDVVARCCPRIIALQAGEIAFDGPREQFFEDEQKLRLMGLEMPRLLRWWRSKRATVPDLPAHVFSLNDVRRALGEVPDRF